MTVAPTRSPELAHHKLTGQTVVIIGGSAGIGLATAQEVRAVGGDVVLTGRNAERLKTAAHEVEAVGAEAFDATDSAALGRFFDSVTAPVDHVMVTAGGSSYAPLLEIDFEQSERDVAEHLWLPIHVARHAVKKVRPGGTLIFIGGTGGRRPGVGLAVVSAITAAMPALIKNLALEIAPVRVNLIAAGFVDTPLSARILGDQLDERRASFATPFR